MQQKQHLPPGQSGKQTLRSAYALHPHTVLGHRLTVKQKSARFVDNPQARIIAEQFETSTMHVTCSSAEIAFFAMKTRRHEDR
jgi:hypothetical protein